jgi:GT2 family glycosyltransferase
MEENDVREGPSLRGRRTETAMGWAVKTDVLIPTHERPGRLRALLESLRRYGAGYLGKVVVVDDSPDPSVRPEEFPELSLKVVRPDGRVLISAARNAGLKELDNEFVYVVDDDNILLPGTLSHPIDYLVRSPSAAAVMPSVLYESRPDLVWVYATPYAPGRWGFDLVGRNRPRNPALENRILPTDALPNAAVFRRDSLLSVGGWNEQLPVMSSGDLCQRLKQAGFDAVADSHAFTLHSVEPPGQRAFWGGHSADLERAYWEKRDWYVFQRHVHPEDRTFALRALWHSWPFLASSVLASLMRRDLPTLAFSVAVARGAVGGLRDAAQLPRSERGYGPLG